MALRPWEREDGDRLGASPRNEEIGRYFGPALDAPAEPPEDPDAFAFAVVERGEVVGRVWSRPGVRPFEIGYFLRRDAWGRGLATHGLRTVARWVLTQGGEAEVVLCIHPENERSLRVAQRAGFKHAGTMDRYAAFKDGTTQALRYRLGTDELEPAE